MKSLNYLMDHILYQLFKIKKHGEKTGNPPTRIDVNKVENRIKFKIKTGYHLEVLTPEMMKLFGSTKSKISRIKSRIKMVEMCLI